MNNENEFQAFDDLFSDWSSEVKSKPKFEPENELQQFFHDCEKFDWYYHYSDDQRVWSRGESESKRLKARSNASPETAAIYSAWHKYNFSGPNFDSEQAPKPAWEDYRA